MNEPIVTYCVRRCIRNRETIIVRNLGTLQEAAEMALRLTHLDEELRDGFLNTICDFVAEPE